MLGQFGLLCGIIQLYSNAAQLPSSLNPGIESPHSMSLD
jgi:hypothetical protein